MVVLKVGELLRPIGAEVGPLIIIRCGGGDGESHFTSSRAERVGWAERVRARERAVKVERSLNIVV